MIEKFRLHNFAEICEKSKCLGKSGVFGLFFAIDSGCVKD
jgi:hypothetical protein